MGYWNQDEVADWPSAVMRLCLLNFWALSVYSVSVASADLILGVHYWSLSHLEHRERLFLFADSRLGPCCCLAVQELAPWITENSPLYAAMRFTCLIKLSSWIEVSEAYLTVIKSYLWVINHCLPWWTDNNVRVILLVLLAPSKQWPLLIVHVEIQLDIMSASNWGTTTHWVHTVHIKARW
jgi:hypothetical protein